MFEQSRPILCPENNRGRFTASFPGFLHDHHINKSLSSSIVFKYKQLHYLKGWKTNQSWEKSVQPASHSNTSSRPNRRSQPAPHAVILILTVVRIIFFILVSLTIKVCTTSAPGQHRDYHDSRSRIQKWICLLHFKSVLFIVSTATCFLKRIKRN